MSDRERTITLPEEAIQTLVAERTRFRRFLKQRLGSETEADDLLQESLLRALQQGGGLRSGERIVPWFYRILRNSVVDHFRHRGADRRKIEGLAKELDAFDSATSRSELDRVVCACFQRLLPSLKPRYAEIIRRVDLRGESNAEVARDLNVSIGAFNVVLHRARAALRNRLEVFCGACSREHCLACTCDSQDTGQR